MAYFVTDRKTREGVLAARIAKHEADKRIWDEALAKHRAAIAKASIL